MKLETVSVHLARIAELLTPFLTAPLAEAQLSQLAAYLEILHRWNARMNLTSVRDPEQVVTRHFGESLFAAQALFPSSLALHASRLLDIGSGAGFPGLPIKIWSPDLSVTLIESQHRKATFLREVIRALDLKDITVSATRAEEFEITDKHAGPGHLYPSHVDPGPVGPGATAGAAPGLTQNIVAAGATPAAPRVTVTVRAVERFDRFLPTAARLATPGRLALLIGQSQVAAAHQVAPGFDWQEPLLIPLSDARVLLMGESS